eukprot:scaffold8306_cov34-Attheya_sp.AAC.1
MDQPIQYERPCQRFPVRGCGYETCQRLPMLRPAELTEDWKIGSRRGYSFGIEPSGSFALIN